MLAMRMPLPGRFPLPLIALAALTLGALSATPPARADAPAEAAETAETAQAAEAYVAELGSEAIGIFGADNVSSQEERDKFRTLLLDALDIRRVGLFALGQYARLPTDDQREAYFGLLADFIVEVYYGRLSGYSNETFEVTGSLEKGGKGREVIVSSVIRFEDAREPLQVQWWLIRSKDGALRVFDVNVAGIWMAQEQRGTFTSQIRNNGGRFEALLDHLRRQIASTTPDEPVAEAPETGAEDTPSGMDGAEAETTSGNG